VDGERVTRTLVQSELENVGKMFNRGTSRNMIRIGLGLRYTHLTHGCVRR
jgi:hypothetical protein